MSRRTDEPLGAAIAPGDLTPVATVIFGEGRTAGPTVARTVGIDHNLLWSYLNRRRMPVAVAQRLADDLTRRAVALMEAAQRLRTAVATSMRAA